MVANKNPMNSISRSLASLLFVCVCLQNASAQIFTNSSLNNFTNTTAYSTNFTVSGLAPGKILRQVTLRFGDGAMYSGELANATITLRDPAGNTRTLINPSNFTTTTDAERRYVNITLREHSSLYTPAAYVTASGNTISNSYPMNYGYWRSVDPFTFSGSFNGTWTLTIQYSPLSTTYPRKYISSSIEFGDSFVFEDIRVTKPNQSCATRKCIETGTVYLGTNTGYPNGQSFPLNIGGCTWNSDNNNAAWFSFIASSSTVELSISGLSRRLQSVVATSSNCSTFSLATGGCPSTMFSGTPNFTRYYRFSYTAGNGFSMNHAYTLTGLTIGQEYILILDGEAAVASDFYIEIISGADGGCTPPLPIVLHNFVANCQNNRVDIHWTTASEINTKQYVLKRSSDGLLWEEVNTINANGNSSVLRQYNTSDIVKEDLIYYKLISEDYDGHLEEYGPISVTCKASDYQWNIWPVPVTDYAQINIFAKQNQKEFLIVSDIHGKIMLEYSVELFEGSNLFMLDFSKLSPGIYHIKTKLSDTYLPLKFSKL